MFLIGVTVTRSDFCSLLDRSCIIACVSHAADSEARSETYIFRQNTLRLDTRSQ